MKKFLLLLSAVFALSAAKAQDMIVLRNAELEEVAAKVLEIGETQIRYRKASNPDGPVYAISKSDVFFIRYENGDKEIVTPYDSAASSAPVQSENEESASRYAVQAAERVPIRNRSWEIGLSPKLNIAIMFLNNDAWAGPAFGAAVAGDYYFSRYSSTCVGAALGYTYNLLSEDSVDIGLSTLDLDIYYGVTGSSSSKLGAKAGFTFGFPLACTMSGYKTSIDISDALNGITMGLFTEIGWSWTHNDVGFRVQYNCTNTYTGTKSKYFQLGVYYAYRF